MRSKLMTYRSVLVSAAVLALQSTGAIAASFASAMDRPVTSDVTPTADEQPNEIGEMNHVDQTAMNDINNGEELHHAH